jgi:hypothetical protein
MFYCTSCNFLWCRRNKPEDYYAYELLHKVDAFYYIEWTQYGEFRKDPQIRFYCTEHYNCYLHGNTFYIVSMGSIGDLYCNRIAM